MLAEGVDAGLERVACNHGGNGALTTSVSGGSIRRGGYRRVVRIGGVVRLVVVEERREL